MVGLGFRSLCYLISLQRLQVYQTAGGRVVHHALSQFQFRVGEADAQLVLQVLPELQLVPPVVQQATALFVQLLDGRHQLGKFYPQLGSLQYFAVRVDLLQTSVGFGS